MASSVGCTAQIFIAFLEEAVPVLSLGKEEMRGHCLTGTGGKLARVEGQHGLSPTQADSVSI